MLPSVRFIKARKDILGMSNQVEYNADVENGLKMLLFKSKELESMTGGMKQITEMLRARLTAYRNGEY